MSILKALLVTAQETIKKTTEIGEKLILVI